MKASAILPEGVVREDWSWCSAYTGSLAALLEGGYARAEQFPGQPGNGKVMVTFYRGERVRKGASPRRDEHYLQIRRASAGRFTVTVGVPEKEERIRAAQRREKYDLEAIVQSHEQYRARVSETADIMLGSVLHSLIPTNEHGYCFDDDTIDRVVDCVQEAMAAIRAGRTLFSEDRHRACVMSVKAKTAKSDASLQTFLSNLVG